MKLIMAVLCTMFLAGCVSQEGDTELKTERDRLSYSIGLNMGNNLKEQSIDIDTEVLSQGLRDAVAGNKPLLTEQEIQDTMMNFQNEMQAKQAERMKGLSEKNKKDGDSFLSENSKKEGVITLPSGLQYKVIKAGAGNSPKSTDTVSVHYRGTLLNGTEFDSSHKRGQPATFKVNGVIKGWTEALQLMKTGAEWELFIPSNLAYGERGAGRNIGPNETLVFEVELLSIK
jgi:FKBP-type peptidyl-prolyl cis-trans isomerase FklB